MLGTILTIPIVALLLVVSSFFDIINGTLGMFAWQFGIVLSFVSVLLLPVFFYQLFLRFFKAKEFTNYQLVMLYLAIIPCFAAIPFALLALSYGGM